MYWISNKDVADSLIRKAKNPEHKINSTMFADKKTKEEEKVKKARLFSELDIKENIDININCFDIDNGKPFEDTICILKNIDLQGESIQNCLLKTYDLLYINEIVKESELKNLHNWIKDFNFKK
jgi:hypothetical protein